MLTFRVCFTSGTAYLFTADFFVKFKKYISKPKILNIHEHNFTVFLFCIKYVTRKLISFGKH